MKAFTKRVSFSQINSLPQPVNSDQCQTISHGNTTHLGEKKKNLPCNNWSRSESFLSHQEIAQYANSGPSGQDNWGLTIQELFTGAKKMFL